MKIISSRQDLYSPRATTIQADIFDYSAKSRMFYADASQLNGFNFQSQLYQDAADLGFIMHNTKTGNAVPFVLSRTDRQEGEIEGWVFTVDSYAVKAERYLEGIEVLIVNT